MLLLKPSSRLAFRRHHVLHPLPVERSTRSKGRSQSVLNCLPRSLEDLPVLVWLYCRGGIGPIRIEKEVLDLSSRLNHAPDGGRQLMIEGLVDPRSQGAARVEFQTAVPAFEHRVVRLAEAVSKILWTTGHLNARAP